MGDDKKIIELIKAIFPKTKIMLVFYCGSIAFETVDKDSDIDVTVVLDNFKGNMHLSLGAYDLFVYSKEMFVKKQNFSADITNYYKLCADAIFSMPRTLIYLDDIFNKTLFELVNVDNKKFMLKHIEAELEYARLRFSISEQLKSHYHIFRVRGMVEQFNNGGKYGVVVAEPFKAYMIDYKKNWNNEKGMSYQKLLKEQLEYMKKYIDKVISNGLE